MISFRNNMNTGAGDRFYPYGEFAQYPLGWIYPYMLNDRGNVNHSPSALITNAEKKKDENNRCENSSWQHILRSLVSLFCGWQQWLKATSREIAGNRQASQHGVVFCSQILFSCATLAFRTNLLLLADFKSDLSLDLSCTNLKLSSI